MSALLTTTILHYSSFIIHYKKKKHRHVAPRDSTIYLFTLILYDIFIFVKNICSLYCRLGLIGGFGGSIAELCSAQRRLSL